MSSKCNATAVYDFTISCDKVPKRETVIESFKGYCKKWTFQKEKGDTGYVHWQGRISLIKRRRLPELLKILPEDHPFKQGRISVTSNAGLGDTFYVIKKDTRIDGPWSDTDEVIYIPRQIREIEKLRPFQQQIVDSADIWDTRHINVIYCQHGNKGKSILVGYLRAHRLGRCLPACNDQKDILRMVCNMPTSRLYVFDMPRAMKQDKLYGFYSAIEMIKDGYCYDDRYHFKEKHFDCPNIWIFTNTLPSVDFLSRDRWVYWKINDSLELERGYDFVSVVSVG